MNYIDLVNNVLRRIREDEVSSVGSTPYSKLIGDFVNDAREVVQNAWDWSALRYTMQVTTEKGVFNYIMKGGNNSLKILHAYNDTSDWDMKYQTPIWFDHQYMMQNPVSGSPQYYVFNGVDDNGDTQIDVYPKPDGKYVLNFNCILRGSVVVDNIKNDPVPDAIRPELLKNDSDRLLIPHSPVLHLAVAFAARERGETGGTSAPEYFGLADKYLSDAIALDAQKHPEETIWFTP
jgi:hypothetical protein